ncbi:IS3 family transposase [Halomonas sp. MCCC 1A11062]|uniref:IS3 family transposase n=1 Tax=Halomonas sp. MCCC 1A11062 TaxID=2733485 RepID=UPI001F394550|nr:IS3 family transposase [Halomonas sp. MCCC 1A11062]MCE8038498.1 IS3 family transposase [Halomonas sp. MCCC 1A11062]
MPEMITGKKTQRYSTEFKVKAVEWSHQAHRSVKGVAEALDIHPFMLSRWRKEYREGQFAMKRVKKAPPDAKQKIQEQDEVARLKRRVSELEEENDILKKSTFSGRGTTEAFRFVWKHRGQHGVKALCRHLNISRSGYYAWANRKPSQRAAEDADLLLKVRSVYNASKGRYGSPRVYQALRREGLVVGENRVARLMREWGMKARVTRVYRRLSKRRDDLKALPNYRLEAKRPVAINQQWSSDVTYIKLGKKYVFLAVVLDLFSRRIISWRLGESLSADFARATLREAFISRDPTPDLLFHTDRGIEYRAHKTQALLNHHRVRHSMNRPGQCTDNAEVESFFKTLKGELLHATSFMTLRQLRKHIKGYIEGYYNSHRLHSGLGYRTPIEFEEMN